MTQGVLRLEGTNIGVPYSFSEPDGLPRAVVQLIPGVGEGFADYAGLAGALAAAGVVFCAAGLPGFDRPGGFLPDGGAKNAKPDKATVFSPNDGAKNAKPGKDGGFSPDSGMLREVVRALYTETRRKYRRLPFIMLGCGFGGTVLRSYAAEYGGVQDENGSTLDGAAFCGVAAASKTGGAAAVAVASALRGADFRSARLQRRAAGALGSEFGGGEPLAAAAYKAALKLQKEVNSDEWAGGVPKSLPIYIISGSDERDGGQALYDRLTDAEVNEVKIKKYGAGYGGGFGGFFSGEVSDDFIAFIGEVCSGVADARGSGFGKA